MQKASSPVGNNGFVTIIRKASYHYQLYMQPSNVWQQLPDTVFSGPNNHSLNSHERSHIFLGVCAAKNKVETRPMRELLARLACKNIEIVLLSDHLTTPWQNWPKVDALICFHSKGFPYYSAWKYITKHHPVLLNNFQKQQLLWDRSVVAHLLRKISVPTPGYFLLFRDEEQIQRIIGESLGRIQLDDYNDQGEPKEIETSRTGKEDKQKKRQNGQTNHQGKFPKLLREVYKSIHSKLHPTDIQQTDDQIIIRQQGSTFNFKKPFVEKPFNSLNHQICIYYPQNMGGGRKRLFAKQTTQSSTFQTVNTIRTDTNYIYENFIPENGFIIKVYTVGVDYMYAQAKKSPALDGIVIRNKDGKEERYPIILTQQEKIICKKIIVEFQQEVCGIKIIRSQEGKSFVLSVDGWSLAKGNTKYWDDCAFLLKKRLYRHFFPHIEFSNHPIHHLQMQNNFRPPKNETTVRVEQLRSIVMICRHADRSPKEKLKIKTKQKRFISLFDGSSPDTKEIKYRDTKSLKKILELTNETLKEMPVDSAQAKEFLQMQKVLLAGGHFQGLTHKIQMKVQDRDDKGKIKKIVIVLKWGGELSYTGYEDALQLGRFIRKQRYLQHDVLNLYSSYRHDIKTYSSQQGRCISTAAAFLKGLLNLEGGLAPIISSMVTVDQKSQKLLDCTPEQNHSVLHDDIQAKLTVLLNSHENLTSGMLRYCQKQDISAALTSKMRQIGPPRSRVEELHKIMKTLVQSIEQIEKTAWQVNSLQERTSSHQNLHDQRNCQDILLVKQRWNKLLKDFYDKQKKEYNVSKLPEIYDTAKHDQRKNKLIVRLIDPQLLVDLKKISKSLAYFVVSNEVGLTRSQKITNATNIIIPLLGKVLQDLSFWRTKPAQEQFWKYKTNQDSWRHLRTRLYFTSASHLYSLLHLLTIGNNKSLLLCTDQPERQKIEDILYMGYLSHVQFRQYQNLTVPEDNYCRFRIEISISYEYHRRKPFQEFKIGGKLYLPNLEEFLRGFIGSNKNGV